MNFAEYEIFIKRNMMDKISDEDLVNMLLGTIVDYFQIKTEKGEPYYFDKAETSKILKGKRKIPRKLMSRVDNIEFTNTLPKFFATSVIPRMKYNHEAIMGELLQSIKRCYDITTETKLFCQMAADNGNMALLLAYIFICSLKNTAGEINAEEGKHFIHLEGIDECGTPAKKNKTGESDRYIYGWY